MWGGRPSLQQMALGRRVRRFAMLTVIAAGLAVPPAVSHWDIYRCAGMGTTHLGRCCAEAEAEPRRVHEWRGERRRCCELEAEGTEAPSSASSTPTPLVGAPAVRGLVIAAVAPPPRSSAPTVATRSRGPPASRLFVQHSSFLL